MHWRYYSLALSHRYYILTNIPYEEVPVLGVCVVWNHGCLPLWSNDVLAPISRDRYKPMSPWYPVQTGRVISQGYLLSWATYPITMKNGYSMSHTGYVGESCMPMYPTQWDRGASWAGTAGQIRWPTTTATVGIDTKWIAYINLYYK